MENNNADTTGGTLASKPAGAIKEATPGRANEASQRSDVRTAVQGATALGKSAPSATKAGPVKATSSKLASRAGTERPKVRPGASKAVSGGRAASAQPKRQRTIGEQLVGVCWFYIILSFVLIGVLAYYGAPLLPILGLAAIPCIGAAVTGYLAGRQVSVRKRHG